MILNKTEVTMLINDLADVLISRGEIGKMGNQEAGAFKLGVQALRAEFIKRIEDYI